uniref:Uncharacterized protein n=1 Tax=Ditylenchus dipsaci TaxID=166011 RepID=A0A915EMA2_9BILA
MLKRYAVVAQEKVDEKSLASYVNKLMALEVMLARAPYSTEDTVRRNFSRWDNMKTLKQANQDYGFVNWITFFDKISNYTDLASIRQGQLSRYTAYFVEDGPLKQLNQDISDATKFDRNLLVNYFFFRLLVQNSKFIPKSQSSSSYVKMVQSPGFDLGMQTHLRRDRSRPDPFDGDDEETRMACARQTMEMMTFANARVFTELLYPTLEHRQNIRKATNKLVQSIRHSYRGMMDELNWLDDSSRKGASAKVDDMQTYETLIISKQDDTYFTALDKLIVYNQQQQYKQLLSSVDRSYFVGPPSTVNAWYAPEFNSITFPEGILREPWFNPNWPASINYGGLGVVAGHEVSHAFDDGGVQWTSLGVDEYSGFQVLDASKYTPNKVNGDNTQGENIADNAGIHASFRAYRNHIALNGPDPQLPDRTFGQITHDQLFFLSFAQTWCQAPPTDDQLFQQILVDPHAPSYNRVFGTVQNYPAFRSAFNCPVGTAYAPKEHCHVWTPVN